MPKISPLGRDDIFGGFCGIAGVALILHGDGLAVDHTFDRGNGQMGDITGQSGIGDVIDGSGLGDDICGRIVGIGLSAAVRRGDPDHSPNTRSCGRPVQSPAPNGPGCHIADQC